MTTYEVGQTITAGPYLNYVNGTLTDTGTLPTCTVTKPDGTPTAGTVTKTATGTYVPSLAASPAAGRYRLALSGGTSNNGGLPWTDVADVWPADPRLIITLADAKAELNHITSINDDELRLYIAAATPVVEEIVGPVLGASRTWPADGGKEAVLIPHEITAITSVTEDGRTLTEGLDFVVNYSAGVIYRGQSLARMNWMPGVQNVVVNYTVGGSSVDPNIALAARIIVAHQYAVGQQARAGRGRSRAGDDLVVLSSGYAVPARAYELCIASTMHRMPGFA